MGPKKKQKVESPPTIEVLWQWKNDDDVWTNFEPEDQKLLEAEYTKKKATKTGANPKFSTSKMSFSTDNSVTFDFSTGCQVNDSTKTQRHFRRLDKGVWEFKDDDGNFIAFYDDDNALIEGAWRALVTGGGTFQTKALSWNAGYDSKYTFTFKTDEKGKEVKATQKNEDSQTVRELRRTEPGKDAGAWDTKTYGIAGAEAPTAATLLGDLAKAASSGDLAPSRGTGDDDGDDDDDAPAAAPVAIDMSLLDPPDYWQPQSAPFEKFDVDLNSDEAKTALKTFKATMKVKTLTVHKLVRLQNEALWRFYALKRFQVGLRNKGDPNEKPHLFHGARVRENMNAIMEYGFDLRVARDGLAGVGIYFATNSSYSNSGYVIQNPDKTKEMFLCRVACGSTAEGKHGMKKPPPKKGKKAAEGDTVDSVHRGKPPIMHVVFDNSQAYPEYLVHYTAIW